MAANKRQEWEIERDREEIATLLTRHRRIPHYRIAEILNARRKAEYKKTLESVTKDLPDNVPVPEIDPPYSLTRQMIDYEVKALKRDFKRRAGEKFDAARAQQLATIDELEKTAWEGYQRSIENHDTFSKKTTEITLKGLERPTDEVGSISGITREVQVPAIKTIESRSREQLVGDARFLMVIDACVKRRNELLSLVTEEVNLNVQPTDIKLVRGFNPDEAWAPQTPSPTPDGSNSSSTPA